MEPREGVESPTPAGLGGYRGSFPIGIAVRARCKKCSFPRAIEKKNVPDRGNSTYKGQEVGSINNF